MSQLTVAELDKLSKDFFTNKRVLIIDPVTMTRASIRKFVESLGCASKDIQQSDNFVDGLEQIKKGKPQIVFCEFDLGNENAFKILQAHLELFPLRMKCCFTVYSSINSPTLTASLADSEVDVFIAKPFTLDTFKGQFFKALSIKLQGGKFDHILDQGRAELRAKDFDKAIEFGAQASEMNKTSPKPFSLMGLAYLGKSEKLKAQQHFELGLKNSPENFICLKNLVLLHMEHKEYRQAYDAAVVFTNHYSLPAEMLPSLMKAALANEKFHDIVNFHKIFMSLGEQADQTLLGPIIAAGLTLSGQWMLKNNNKAEGLDALAKAQKLGATRIGILKKLANVYLEFGQSNLAVTVFDQIEASGKLSANDLRLLELEIKAPTFPAPEVLRLARDALAHGIKTVFVYETLIKKNKEVGRSISAYEDLIEEAIRNFPEQKALFENIIK